MGKKKPFIDKKKASTYHLVHRSQRDIGSELLEEGDVAGAGMVLWPSPGNAPSIDQQVLQEDSRMNEWRRKMKDLGLLDENPGQFLKPISGTGTFVGASGRVEDPMVSPGAIAEENLLEVERQFDSIPLSAEYMDEDIANILFHEDFEEGDYEELNDDFVLDAAKIPDEDDAEAFDFDKHITELMEKARLEREGRAGDYSKHEQGQADRDFFASMKPVHEEDDDDDSFANLGSLPEYTVATMPGVVAKLKPDEERALCQKFEAALAEYDSDDLGEGMEEEIPGPREVQGDAGIQAALDHFLEERKDEQLAMGIRVPSKNQGSTFVTDLEGDAPPPEVIHRTIEETLAEADATLARGPLQPPTDEILIDGKSYFSERERNPFDCESILSTYSNLDNNPVTIDASSNRRRRKKATRDLEESQVQQIQLSNKTGLPLGVLPTRVHGEDRFEDDTIISVNRGLARNKKETKEEKKERKASVKVERQIARIQKKITREVFSEEFQKRAVDPAADDVAGKSVFRYS